MQRPHNDRRANELIRKVTGIVYTGFEKTRPTLEAQAKAVKPTPAKLDLTKPRVGPPAPGSGSASAPAGSSGASGSDTLQPTTGSSASH